jgi:dipeptidyl aminopeptidase/acylaminoacyl peptidase
MFKKNHVFYLFLIIFILVGFFVNAQASEKRAFVIDDYYDLKEVSNLSLSPCGKSLAFAVKEYDLKRGKSNSDIFLLDLKTSDLTQVTNHEKSDHSPRWSEDGKKLYFISSREDSDQLWEKDLSNGEFKKLSDFYSGISEPFLSNDGGGFYFTSTVFPECMENNECNKKHSDLLENGPTQAHFADSLLYRHWNYYRDWQYDHLFYLDLKNGKKQVTPISKGSIDYPAYNLGAGPGFDISPDGVELCVVANHDDKKVLANSTNSDLFLMNLKEKTFNLTNITKDNKAFDGSPIYSPNGKYIAYTFHTIPGYESDRMQLAVYDRKTKKITHLTEEVDNWISDFQWAPDSKSIYYTVQEKARLPIYNVNIKNLKNKKILEADYIKEFLVTPDGKYLVFSRSSIGEPYEIWKYRIGKKNSLKRLTTLNKEVEDKVDIRPPKELWVEGAEGKKVHMFLVKPHDFDETKKYPLIINIHGGPQGQWYNSFRGDWQVYPGAGYVLAFPNPHGSTGFGQEYTRAISGDYGGKVMTDIKKVTDYLEQLPYVDKDRIGIMGWSWGGYAIMWLQGHTTRYKAMASMMGIYDMRSFYGATEELWYPQFDMDGTPWDKPELYQKYSPSSYVKKFQTPCLVVTGERDYRVPYTLSLEFFTGLQKMEVPSWLILFKNDGHWPDRVKSMSVYYNAHLEWFHKYLGGGKAPYDTKEMIRNLAFDAEK